MIGTQDNFERLSFEIDSLLTTLRDVNGSMAQYCQINNTNSVTMHTLQRHQEILKDYTNEFHKTRSNIEKQMTRERLLEPNKKDLAGQFQFGSPSRANSNDFLLKENESIRKYVCI